MGKPAVWQRLELVEAMLARNLDSADSFWLVGFLARKIALFFLGKLVFDVLTFINKLYILGRKNHFLIFL